MKKKVVSVVALLILATSSYAQSSFSMHFDVAPAMGAFKLGEYEDNFEVGGSLSKDDPNGFAGTGIGIGLEGHIPIGDKGVNIILGLDCYRHSIKSSIRNSYLADLDANKTINFSEYYNLPVSAGIHYEYQIGEKVSMFGQFTGAFNFLKISKSKLDITSNGGSFAPGEKVITRTYGISPHFGYGFKVGFLLSQRYILGIGFKNFGAHSINAEHTESFDSAVPESSSYSNTNNYVDVKSVLMLTISLGIQF